MTPAETTRRRRLAQDALLDAIFALRSADDEAALVLTLMGALHISAVSDSDRAIELWRAAMREAKT